MTQAAAARPILPFVSRVLGWGVVLFALWWFAGNAVSLATGRVSALLIELIAPVEKVGTALREREVVFFATTATNLARGGAVQPNLEVEVPVNVRKHTFSIPFFLALLLAAWPRGAAWKAALGASALVLLAATGLAFEVVIDLLQVRAPGGAPLFAMAHTAREAIGLGYQLGILIFPTVGPLLLWGAMDAPGIAALAKQRT